MKVSTTNENRIAKHLIAPIPFFPKNGSTDLVEDNVSERDRDATAHEVRYDHTNAESPTYKVYLSPFDNGLPEEWLKFRTKLKIIMNGNGLTTGPARYNLTRALLKGEALRDFNNKAQELGNETVANHTTCLQAVTERIFPKNALQAERRHLRSSQVRLNQKVTVSEFFAHWREINDYLALFPPHGGDDQKLDDDEIVELIYEKLPKRMKADLERMNDFDINDATLITFRGALERLELSYELDSVKPEPKKESTDKKSGKKRGKGDEDSSSRPKKKPCMLCEKDNHGTDDCTIVKQQIQRMKATYRAQSPEERKRKKREWQKNKPPNREEIHAMVKDTVKESVQEVFQTLFKKSGDKRARNNPDSDSDSDHEHYRMDDLDLDLEKVKVREEMYALSALRAPPQKRQKTQHLTPVTVGIVNTRLGKSRFKKIRILFDSGSSGSIIVEKFVRKLRMKSDKNTVWDTKGGTFRTSKKCKTTFILNEFYKNRAIEWNLHVDSSPGPHRYDMILGRDVMTELGITIDFKEQAMTWDDSTVHMKDPDSLSDMTNPISDFFWKEDIYETEALNEASIRLKKILDAKYEAADLEEIVRTCEHLDTNEQEQLHALLRKYEHLFDGTLGTWNNEPYDIELKDGAQPYHSRPFPIPKVHERTLKIELERLVEIGVLKRKNNSEWAAPTFIIPKKDGSVRFISDFRELNKHIKCKPFPIPKIQDLLLKLEGFQYATSLDLNMGYYHIKLTPFSKSLCTIVTPWGKYEYQRLPMGLCNSLDIFQERMFELFSDLEYVRAYIDDLLVTSSSSFEEHLERLDKVFLQLSEAGLKVNANKSHFAKSEIKYLGYWIT